MRTSLRSLVANPAFSVVAVLTLALGIGANTAIFSVVNAVLLRPLPYVEADRIVHVWTTEPDERRNNHTAPDFLAFQRTGGVAPLAGYRAEPATVVPAGADPVRLTGANVTVDYFAVFGTAPLMGRVFGAEADAARSLVAVIGERLWRDTLGSDPAIVGRQLRINGLPYTVVGVVPASFDYPRGARVWTLSPLVVPTAPLDVEGDLLQERKVRYFAAIGRLPPGASMAQAEAKLRVVADDLTRREPETNAGRGVRLEPLREYIIGDVRPALLVLLGAVAVVLLIACANVASLLLARASGRQRELAIRTALGATRGRLVRLLLSESFTLTAVGGALGLLIGTWAVRLLMSIVPEGLPRVEHVGLDWRVAAAAVAMSLASGLMVGLLPAWQATRGNSVDGLKQSGDRATTGGRRRARTRAALVVGEVSLTLILLVTAGLLANSFLRLGRVDPGFAVEEVTVIDLPVPPGKYSDGKKQAAFYEALVEALAARGEIRRVAAAFPNPLSESNASGSFEIEGRPRQSGVEQPQANLASISPDYFRSIGIPLLAGRDFTKQDREPAPATLIVNAAFARRYFPGQTAVGKRIRFGQTEEEWLTIVGVAADSRNRGLDIEPAPLMYISYQYFALPMMTIVVQSTAGTGVVASTVRAELKRLDPELPIDSVRPMREVVSRSVAEPRFRTILLGAFAVAALALAAIGVYGLISYSVTQRTREIGIRVALGARPAQVMRPIVSQGMMLACIGVGVGLVGALAATRLVATFLFGIRATDPLTFALVAALLLGVAFLASYIPSRRALKVDPLIALRAE